MDANAARRRDAIASGDLTLTLSFLDGRVRVCCRDAQSLRDDIARTSAGIEAIERRLGVAGPVGPTSRARRVAPLPPLDWREFLEASRARLAERGVDVDALDLDALLDPAEARRIERRFRGDFRIEAGLDRADVVAAVVAGIAGALVDLLVVGLPKKIKATGLPLSLLLGPGPLPKLLKAVELPHDNALAKHVKASYDRIVAGMGGWDHRVLTLGHDPLLGLVVGVLDILRGQMTWIDTAGRWRVDETAEPVAGVLRALAVQIGHTLSDAFTVMGVPAPGWVATQLLAVRVPGTGEATVAGIARRMYLDGHDARFAQALRSTPAAIDMVLRAYVGIRGEGDPGFAAGLRRGRGDGDGLSRSARFEAMGFVAHFVACAVNAGKVTLLGFGGLNEAEWRAFLQAGMAVVRTRLTSPAEVLADRAKENLAALADGWPALDMERVLPGVAT